MQLLVPRPPLLQCRILHLPCPYAFAELLVGALRHVAHALHFDGLQLDLQVQQLCVAFLPLSFTGTPKQSVHILEKAKKKKTDRC